VKGGIQLRDVRKVYQRLGARGRLNSLKGALLHGTLRSARIVEGFVALDGVTFSVQPGEALAIVGPNGAGKSTLLKLVSGILRPTSGTVEIEGRVTALIELGAGFHPEITGRENALINGMLLGLSRREIEERMDEIAAFADIGEFFDLPVKTYSSGMYVRLGFAVAVLADPDILLVDEVLAVGDEAFTHRCLDQIARMRRAGVTLVMVSHDLDLVSQLADRAVYLEGGRVLMTGPADTVVARYRSDVAGEVRETDARTEGVRVLEEGRRWGNGIVEIRGVTLESGGRETALVPWGADCTVRIRYVAHEPVEDFVFGIAWHGEDGTPVGGHNTAIEGAHPRRLEGEGEVRCRYARLDLAPGRYLLDVAVHAEDGLAYDYWCRAASLSVTAPVGWPGVWAPPHRWESDGPDWELPRPAEP